MTEVVLRKNNQDFDDIVRLAEAGIREAVSAPPTELVAVKSSMGGFEMRVQRIGFFPRFWSEG